MQISHKCALAEQSKAEAKLGVLRSLDNDANEVALPKL